MAEHSDGQLVLSEHGNVETLVVLQPILLDTASRDQDGRLVMANGRLIAILVHHEDLDEPANRGWFLEAGLGRLQGLRPARFDSLDAATRWVRLRLKTAA